MKFKFAVLAALLLSACSSNTHLTSTGLLKPEIALAQLGGTSFMMEMGGQLSIGYNMQVRNRSGEPITLRRLELQTMGSTPYLIRRIPLYFKEPIAPGETRIMQFSVDALSRGGRTASAEPVTLRGIAYFESPTGAFQTVFVQYMQQPDGMPPR